MNGFDFEAMRSEAEHDQRKAAWLVVWVTIALAVAFGLLGVAALKVWG